jgi:hypothetical protein
MGTGCPSRTQSDSGLELTNPPTEVKENSGVKYFSDTGLHSMLEYFRKDFLSIGLLHDF